MGSFVSYQRMKIGNRLIHFSRSTKNCEDKNYFLNPEHKQMLSFQLENV